MSEQIDIAVDLDVVPRPLPEIEFLREFAETLTAPPPQLIDGILHRGCKMILGGTSKSNKSWCLLDLAMSVASGQDWWGRRCTKMPVVYINFELHRWSIGLRINALCGARPECKGLGDSLALWNLRGRNADLTLLRPKLEEQLARHQFGLIILDPAYKVLGDRDENANGEIAGLMNELEALAQSSGAAVVIAHHFAKGDSAAKNAIDRMSGAGVWARDPDSILVLTPHEEEDCFTVSTVLRNLGKEPPSLGSGGPSLAAVGVRVPLGIQQEITERAKRKLCTTSNTWIGMTPLSASFRTSNVQLPTSNIEVRERPIEDEESAESIFRVHLYIGSRSRIPQDKVREQVKEQVGQGSESGPRMWAAASHGPRRTR